MNKPLNTTALTHGRYTIRAAILNKVPTARAFLTGGVQGTVAEATASTVDEAIEKLKEQLDETIRQSLSERRHADDLDFDVPTSAEFGEALSIIKPHGGQLAMLRAHSAAGDEGLNSGELADAAGYAGFKSANLQYAKLAKAIAAAIECDLPRQNLNKDADVANGVLAASGPNRGDDDYVWVMHPELHDALEKSGLLE